MTFRKVGTRRAVVAQSLTGWETPSLAGMCLHAAGPLWSVRELGTKVNRQLLHPGHWPLARLWPLPSMALPPALNPSEYLHTHTPRSGGCCCRRLLSLLWQDQHEHGMGLARAAASQPLQPTGCPESLSHPPAAPLHPWALAMCFTKPGRQRDGATALLPGCWRRKKSLVFCDESWGRVGGTLPSSPHSWSHSCLHSGD